MNGTEAPSESRIDPARTGFARAFPPTPHAIPAAWLRLTGALVLLSLTLEHGFTLGRAAGFLNLITVLGAICFALDLALAPFKAAKGTRPFARRRLEYLLLALFLTLLVLGSVLPLTVRSGLLTFLHLRSGSELTVNLVKLYVLLSLSVQLLRGLQRLFAKDVRPELILAGSFATLIVIGTLLLWMPNSSARADAPIRGIEALFTSTSAVCVTGLAVRDTGTDFSNFGQTVILILFQVGGLGIITFVAFLSVFSSRTLPVPQMVAFQQIINAPSFSDLKRQIVGILAATIVIEVIGAGLIYLHAPGAEDPLDRIKWSVFHSVSAFCNAGFALQSNSLEPFYANAGLMFTVMALIVLGGLGFLVIPELLGHPFTRSACFRRIGFFRRLHAGRAPARLSVQTKLSLHVTWALLLAGLVAFFALEYRNILRDHPVTDSLLIAMFQSVTVRTAGFNTVAIGQLQDATLVFLMMLMVIGASPVSMGGGIKTVSFGVLLLALRAFVMRRERVEAFGRTLPVKTLFAALSVFVLYVLCAGIGIFLLAVFDPEMKLQDQAFEVISALSTVGLSTGITAELSPASKLVLCAAMFIGRVGPISLMLSVFQGRRVLSYQLPDEEVVVG